MDRYTDRPSQSGTHSYRGAQLNLSPSEYGLLTDLYQLTMTACYVGEGIAERPASFELFFRRLPPDYGWAIAMGLAQGLEYLEELHFTGEQIEALEATGTFTNAPAAFWELLRAGCFTGDVWAVPEGTAIFPNEPLLRIEAPLWQAQLVETYLLNTLNYQTTIATKAARLREVAGDDKRLLEFGTRRAFSPQGALWAARAALAGGLDATSNVLAALKLGVRPSGTMAHSLVMAIGALSGSEDDAFAAFGRYFPEAPLLIDTFDTLAAARRLAERVATNGEQVTGVRLDSGDIGPLSQRVREWLPEAAIFASGDIDEGAIARLQAQGAEIDGYGVGTRLVTGTTLNGVYKLVEVDGIATMKQSSRKATYPGRKQIFRSATHDRLGLAAEIPQAGERPLLQQVVAAGTLLQSPEPLPVIRQRSRQSVRALPASLRRLEGPAAWEVRTSAVLDRLTQTVAERLRAETKPETKGAIAP